MVAIDIPIGLLDNSSRQADVLARRGVGPRWQSVFMTPVREALLADDHASAIAINQRLAGKGVSRPGYGLRTKILEVDSWIRSWVHTVIEGAPRALLRDHGRRPPGHPKEDVAGALQAPAAS
jgi:predicted RNase H-like nuclease